VLPHWRRRKKRAITNPGALGRYSFGVEMDIYKWHILLKDGKHITFFIGEQT
jgi:hypothetical protein